MRPQCLGPTGCSTLSADSRWVLGLRWSPQPYPQGSSDESHLSSDPVTVGGPRGNLRGRHRDGNVCISADTDQLEGATIRIEESFSFSDARAFFAPT